MNRTWPIYTERNNCQDCYKCLRQCPVKAIKIEEGSASIIPEQCIFCGHCVQVCPVGAKRVRNDIPGLIRCLESGEHIIACLAPSWVSEFPGVEPAVMVNAFRKMGFFGVSETALGAELVSRQTAQWLAGKEKGIFISSCCPSIVQFICRYYPELKENLVPVLSPMEAHAVMLRELYGEDVTIAFFGPCIAKKNEVEQHPGLTDFAITFKNLKDWFDDDIPGWETMPASGGKIFIPYPAGKGNFFPVDGGMIANLKSRPSLTDMSYMSFSGIRHVKEVLGDMKQWKPEGKIFLELLVCEGGCIKGPGTISKSSAAMKRQRILRSAHNAPAGRSALTSIPGIFTEFTDTTPVTRQEVNMSDLTNALHATGKFTKEDELNCGGCGYDSCIDFAKAMLEGKAERMMCVSYTRKVSQDKASVLLKKIPYGVVVVDDTLKVIDSNRKFAELLGGEVLDLFDLRNNLEGADVKKLLPFHKMFTSVLQTGEEMIEHTLRVNGTLLHVSIVTIQPNKIVCGVIQNMQEPEIRKDMVLNSVKQVIHQNMEVVQKIAYLLGENASFTESMLNSIVESDTTDDTKKPGL